MILLTSLLITATVTVATTLLVKSFMASSTPVSMSENSNPVQPGAKGLRKAYKLLREQVNTLYQDLADEKLKNAALQTKVDALTIQQKTISDVTEAFNAKFAVFSKHWVSLDPKNNAILLRGISNNMSSKLHDQKMSADNRKAIYDDILKKITGLPLDSKIGLEPILATYLRKAHSPSHSLLESWVNGYYTNEHILYSVHPLAKDEYDDFDLALEHLMRLHLMNNLDFSQLEIFHDAFKKKLVESKTVSNSQSCPQNEYDLDEIVISCFSWLSHYFILLLPSTVDGIAGLNLCLRLIFFVLLTPCMRLYICCLYHKYSSTIKAWLTALIVPRKLCNTSLAFDRIMRKSESSILYICLERKIHSRLRRMLNLYRNKTKT